MYTTRIIYTLIGCIMGLMLTGYASQAQGYFEYRYHCTIISNLKINISLQSALDSDLCMNYIQILDNNISYYKSEIKIAEDNISQGNYIDYWTSYRSQVQSRLLQSNVLHSKILSAMSSFEEDLFRKTMLYLRYRYKVTRQELQDYVTRREKSIIRRVQEGDVEGLHRVIEKHDIERRKLENLNLMLNATNFNELMPFYIMHKQGNFEY